MQCFESPMWMRERMKTCKHLYGKVTIDGVDVEFSFSPYFMDGDVYTDDSALTRIVTHIIPVYVYNKLEAAKQKQLERDAADIGEESNYALGP